MTDKGVPFDNRPHQPYVGCQALGRVYDEYDIKHRCTKPAHPWTIGQIECMNRTLKEATVLRYHDEAAERSTNTCMPR